MAKQRTFRLHQTEEERRSNTTRGKKTRIRKANEEMSEWLDRRRRWQRAQKLMEQRSGASFAEALKSYRTNRKLTRTALADLLGVTRRALFNYETGARSVPGEIMEAIAKRGDAELHQLFAVPYEQPSEEQRRTDAKLAIDLFVACKEIFPEADEKDLIEAATDGAASWQPNVKPTPKNLEKVAKREIDKIKDFYALKGLEELEREG
ncbi:helix-turn-helix domain-containing protein [Phaeobacter inhibens]|uniref:helix-turn-helix domain-containing protein n=1 Tax=Phaeobacter inhibens TaxID=221822 RepID=UPI000C9A358D|nr:helix-turn-helix transcriptional regulator [Phaeobacter inhibens]MDO6757617.1 helix-turn-helix transcriptional regulator [Phaeobacter inhibens]